MGIIISIVLTFMICFFLFDIIKSVLTGVCIICEYFKNYFHATSL